MSWVVAIPTYRRPAVLQTKTLRFLRDGGVSSDRIYVFVASEEEKTLYESIVDRDLYREMIVGQLGLVNQRKFITEYFPLNKQILFCDDDVSSMWMRIHSKRMERVGNIVPIIDSCFLNCMTANSSIWSVYPVQNAMFMSDTMSTDLKLIMGAFFGIINQMDPAYDLTLGDALEDKERTLKYFTRDGTVVRFNQLCVKYDCFTPGGMYTPERKANTEAATQALVDMYPSLITRSYKTRLGIWDIRFKRRPNVSNTAGTLTTSSNE
jgi:hypothetical protein